MMSIPKDFDLSDYIANQASTSEAPETKEERTEEDSENSTAPAATATTIAATTTGTQLEPTHGSQCAYADADDAALSMGHPQCDASSSQQTRAFDQLCARVVRLCNGHLGFMCALATPSLAGHPLHQLHIQISPGVELLRDIIARHFVCTGSLIYTIHIYTLHMRNSSRSILFHLSPYSSEWNMEILELAIDINFLLFSKLHVLYFRCSNCARLGN